MHGDQLAMFYLQQRLFDFGLDVKCAHMQCIRNLWPNQKKNTQKTKRQIESEASHIGGTCILNDTEGRRKRRNEAATVATAASARIRSVIQYSL